MVTATKHLDSVEAVRERALHRPLTAEDLAALPDDGNRYEIIGGKLIASPSPTYRHQQVSMKLGNALDTFLTSTSTGEIVAAPMDVHLSPNDVVQPDLLARRVRIRACEDLSGTGRRIGFTRGNPTHQ